MDQVSVSELGISQKDLGIATPQNERGQIEQSLQREFGDRFSAISRLVPGFLERYTSLSSQFPEGDQRRTDLHEIATAESLHGRKLVDPMEIPTPRHQEYDHLSMRTALMEIYARDPELAQLIVDQRIIAGHGSSSGSLLAVAGEGLRPWEQVLENSGLIASGERSGDYTPGIQSDGVSFARWDARKSLVHYAEYLPEVSETTLQENIHQTQQVIEGLQTEEDPEDRELQQKAYTKKIDLLQKTLNFLGKSDKTPDEQLLEKLIRSNFPLIYLIGELNSSEQTVPIRSSVPTEFVVRGGVSRERIKTLLVPIDRVEGVEKITVQKGASWKIKPIEAYRSYTK